MTMTFNPARHHQPVASIETTLASKTLQTRLRALKAASYQIHLAYLWLASPELAVARVRERVQRGGHSVPEVTIRRRYFSGLRNLFEVYMSLVDDWFIYDNSHTSPMEIASEKQGKFRIQNPHIFETIERLVKPLRSKKFSLPLKSLALSKKINAALRLAASDAIEAHRRSGHPLAVWHDGRVVMLPPDQAAAERSPDMRNPAPKTA